MRMLRVSGAHSRTQQSPARREPLGQSCTAARRRTADVRASAVAQFNDWPDVGQREQDRRRPPSAIAAGLPLTQARMPKAAMGKLSRQPCSTRNQQSRPFPCPWPRALMSLTLRVNDGPLDELGAVLATPLRFVAVRTAQIVYRDFLLSDSTGFFVESCIPLVLRGREVRRFHQRRTDCKSTGGLMSAVLTAAPDTNRSA